MEVPGLAKTVDDQMSKRFELRMVDSTGIVIRKQFVNDSFKMNILQTIEVQYLEKR